MLRMSRPETAKIDLPDGEWLLVKRRLTSGESRARTRAGVRSDGGYDLVAHGEATVLAYVLDWSVTDVSGTPVVIRDQPQSVLKAAVDNLEPESYTQILRAIEAHEEAMAKERTEEKKQTTGETRLKPSFASAAP